MGKAIFVRWVNPDTSESKNQRCLHFTRNKERTKLQNIPIAIALAFTTTMQIRAKIHQVRAMFARDTFGQL